MVEVAAGNLQYSVERISTSTFIFQRPQNVALLSYFRNGMANCSSLIAREVPSDAIELEAKAKLMHQVNATPYSSEVGRPNTQKEIPLPCHSSPRRRSAGDQEDGSFSNM